MTIKEYFETNEKIKNYKEEGKLTAEIANEVIDFDDVELDDDWNEHEERMKLFYAMRESVKLHEDIEKRLQKLINLFENLQNQVDGIKISD